MRWTRSIWRRAGWGVADQALSSLTNFGLGIVAARTLGPAAFGTFSLAFATYLVVLNASRGLATDPLVVRFSDADTDSWRGAVGAATMTSVVIGAVTGACSVLASAALDGASAQAFAALGLMLPGLMLQDAWRYAFFAAGRARAAFLNDLAWAALLVPSLLYVIGAGADDVHWFVLAWGIAAAGAGLVGIIQARLLPQVHQVGRWLRSHGDLGRRYLVENISFSAAMQIRLSGLGAIAGLAAVGAIRGAELLLGPVNLVIMGVGNLVAVPEASRLAARDLQQFRHFIRRLAVLLGAIGVACGAAVGLVLPESVGRQLLGDTWPPAEALLLPTTLMVVMFGVWSSAWTGIRALGAARRGLRAQIIGAASFLGGALAGALLGGAVGAAWGSAAGNFVAAVVWWWHLSRATDEADTSGAPGRHDVPVIVSGG